MDFLNNSLEFLKAGLEIGILWFFYYWVLLFFEGTVAVQVLKGVGVLALVFLIAGLLHLEVLAWLFGRIITVVAVTFVIIFQPELRRGLARIGGETLFRLTPRHEEVVEEIVKGALALSRRRIGAIIAVEKQTNLKSYAQSGVPLDSTISSEVVQTIFMPGTPLHDGGVVISNGRLVAAACLFPLSQETRHAKTLGTRHRAGLGLSEETDAVVIIVSEETGVISIAVKGNLTREVEREQLARVLYGISGHRGRRS